MSIFQRFSLGKSVVSWTVTLVKTLWEPIAGGWAACSHLVGVKIHRFHCYHRGNRREACLQVWPWSCRPGHAVSTHWFWCHPGVNRIGYRFRTTPCLQHRWHPVVHPSVGGARCWHGMFHRLVRVGCCCRVRVVEVAPYPQPEWWPVLPAGVEGAGVDRSWRQVSVVGAAVPDRHHRRCWVGGWPPAPVHG